jgi:hypothetical protein
MRLTFSVRSTEKHAIMPVLAAVVVLSLSTGDAAAACESAEQKQTLDALILALDFWDLDQDDLETRAGAGLEFYWVSKDRASARSQAKGLTFQAQPVVEAIVRFSSNAVSEVMLSFFNRGDADAIGEDDFRKKAGAVEKMLGQLAGAKGKDTTQRQDNTSDRKLQTTVWANATNTYCLECGLSRTRDKEANARLAVPEFVNLTIRRSSGASAAPGGGEKSKASSTALKKKTKTTPEGDVYLDQVPMVDQGEKGYCAVAAGERVLRYYGIDVNQHEIAQRANTAAIGTDTDSFVKALKAIAGKAKLQVKVLENFDMSSFTKLIQNYNSEARRTHASQIVLPDSGMINISDIYAQMDKNTFLQSRAKSTGMIERFVREIQSKISGGYPLFWGVELGIVDEKVELPQKAGGHMRLIIGYNSKTKEIIYSDTWGPGHEMKRMSQKDAFAITSSLHSMEPR